jgi:hypothetical protein
MKTGLLHRNMCNEICFCFNVVIKSTLSGDLISGCWLLFCTTRRTLSVKPRSSRYNACVNRFGSGQAPETHGIDMTLHYNLKMSTVPFCWHFIAARHGSTAKWDIIWAHILFVTLPIYNNWKCTPMLLFQRLKESVQKCVCLNSVKEP